MASQEKSGKQMLEAMRAISKDSWTHSEEVAAAFLRDDRVRKSILDILKKRNAIAGANLLNYKLLVYGRMIEERLFEKITDLDGIYSYVYRIADICISGSLRDAAREGVHLAGSLDAMAEDEDGWSYDHLGALAEVDPPSDEALLTSDEAIERQSRAINAEDRFRRKLSKLGWSDQIPRTADAYQQLGRPRKVGPPEDSSN